MKKYLALFAAVALALLPVPAFAGPALPGPAQSQSSLVGCIYSPSGVTLTSTNNQAALQCDSTGKLMTDATGGAGGTVDIDQTTPGTTNGVVVNSSALPSGAATSAKQDTMIAAMATPAEIIPSTSGGLSLFYLTAANSTNATNVKASAGQLYTVELSNNSATLAYVSFYNTAGTPTCGTGIVAQAMIPANSTSGAGWVSNSLHGKAFGTGIGICVTTGIAGTGSVAASAYTITLGYK